MNDWFGNVDSIHFWCLAPFPARTSLNLNGIWFLFINSFDVVCELMTFEKLSTTPNWRNTCCLCLQLIRIFSLAKEKSVQKKTHKNSARNRGGKLYAVNHFCSKWMALNHFFLLLISHNGRLFLLLALKHLWHQQCLNLRVQLKTPTTNNRSAISVWRRINSKRIVSKSGKMNT